MSNMENVATTGDVIDKMSIDEIINHPDFVKLEVFKGFNRIGPDYWEITFAAKPLPGTGQWITMFNQKIPFSTYKFYKTKEEKQLP